MSLSLSKPKRLNMATARDQDDLHSVLAAQHAELMAYQSLDSDLDYAFQLQLQEAMSASLAFSPSTSSPPTLPQPPSNDAVPTTFASLQSDELTKFAREIADQEQAKLEMCKTTEDLHRSIYDRKFAEELARIPEDEWADWGDNFEKPFGEGSSSDVGACDDHVFKLYCKGLLSEEMMDGKKVMLCGIGIAICDAAGNLIFRLEKPLTGFGSSKIAAETKALIEGLNAALSLGLKRIQILSDYYPLYKFATRRWPPKQRKVAVLVNQVFQLQGKFMNCNTYFVARNDMKDVFMLARAAIVSQITRPADSSHGRTLKETCFICLEDTDTGHMFSVDGCLHRYCFSCMRQHVEVKMRYGMLPKCPYEGCKSELKVDSCRKFLTPKSLEILNQRVKEASIPVTERIYCPNPRCSTLMRTSEVLKYAKNASQGANPPGAVKCLNCDGLFCINCKVPWHRNMTCNAYKRWHSNPSTEDVKLKSLASSNLWRQCVKCNHMIELSEGCNHITCRCGYEFCYNCGAEWKNKAATCFCPLWDEGRILFHNSDDENFEEEEDDEIEDEEFFDSDLEFF